MASRENRIAAIDLGRGLAVLFMIGVHVLITYSTVEVQHSIFGYVIGFLGSPPAAPVFMTLMGVSFYFSRNTGLAAGIKRGLQIILLGYLLNFLRGVVPVALARWWVPATAAGIPDAVANVHDALTELDILQFAGLSLIVMAILRQLQVNRYVLLVLAAVTAYVSPMLWGITSDLPGAAYVLDYLWGDKPSPVECIGNLVSFPFFPWFTFVLVGMYLGDTLSKSTDPHRTLRRAGLAGAGLLLVGSVIVAPDLAYQFNDFYHSRPVAMAVMVGFVLAWVYLCDLAVIGAARLKWGALDSVLNVLYYWSRNITSIYVFQWVLIMVGADLLFGFNTSSYLTTIAIIIGVTAASHLLNEIYLSIRTRKSGAHARTPDSPN